MRGTAQVLAALLLAAALAPAHAQAPGRRIEVADRPSAVLHLREVVRLGSLEGAHDGSGG